MDEVVNTKRFYLKLLLCAYAASHAHYIETAVKKGDSFNTILRENKVSETSIDIVNASLGKSPILSQLKPGDQIKLHISDNNILVSAYIQQNNQDYVLNKTRHGFDTAPLTKKGDVKTVSVLYDQKADTKEQLITQRAVKTLFPEFTEGTVFGALKDNTLISVKAISKTNTHYAFLQNTNGFPVYTDANGKILSPAISRTPVEHFWISSRFNPKRLHPISKKIRPHNGVDLSGPINTPIWAAANGVISHISNDTTFGNMIIIKHANDVETVYAHLNKYHDDLHVGKKVQAFETIGYVGSTGISTGYHLHFEIRVNGKACDPLTVELPNSRNITSLALPYYF